MLTFGTLYTGSSRFSHNVSTFKHRLTEFNFYRSLRYELLLLLYVFHCSLICIYLYDDVSGCFYPFVNKLS